MSRPLVLIHGWGQSAAVWHGQSTVLSERFMVHAPNLPGHGGAAGLPPERWGESLLETIPDGAVLVGWSLGGMLAIQLAQAHPERIAGLALVGTTPCFCMRSDWPHGCADEVFEGFVQGVEAQSARMMSRFFALMLHGDRLSRPEYNAVARAAIDRRRPPSEQALKDGLTLLDQLDLRATLSAIDAPCLVMHGESDGVVPVAAARYLSERIDGAAFVSFEQCGHAPFLTQAERFNRELEAWCLKSISTSIA
ncbi:MAG TPA: alpha/beta fold hydrolase [Mariprofundaceae bacterium]|nr:alpha/beta fold hydrolase [Mariprofundaceae bacterium]